MQRHARRVLESYTGERLRSGLRCFHGFSSKTQHPPRRIIFGSCSCQSEDLSYWQTIVDLKPDLVLLLGDNVYGRNSTSLEEAYSAFFSHPAVKPVFSSIPILATLDDNDYTSDKELGKRIFLDHFQTRDNNRVGQGVYSSHTWGDDLQVVLLDVRYSANAFARNLDPSGSPLGPFVPDASPSQTLLGRKQWDWLRSELEKPARLRLIASPIQVLATGHRWDCWNLFPREKERLLRLIGESCSENESQALILSGDRHVAGFYMENQWAEVTSSSLTHSVPVGLLDDETDANRIGGFIHDNNFGVLVIDYWRKEVVASIRSANTGKLCQHPCNPFIRQFR